MLNVFSALGQQANSRPQVIAFSDGNGQASYQHLEEISNAVASAVQGLPKVIAILAPNGIDWVAGWLGLAKAGKTIVTLPAFFSIQQLEHIIADSGTAHIVCMQDMAWQAQSLGLPVSMIDDLIKFSGPRVAAELAAQSRHIVYTSGTTGAPKGVRLGAAQLDWSAQALLQAVNAGPEDRYLSVLPFAMLLEQICGICVPILAGAPVIIAADVAVSLMAGNSTKLLEAVDYALPTMSVLVPQFLSAWVGALQLHGGRAPTSLRYVAVGGAPLAGALAEQAVNLGIPVHEGYGLSECCSVVALNRPGRRLPRSVGQPLDGLKVSIVDDEIIVSGPAVMDGYLHGDDLDQRWATGDLGHIDEMGNLHIAGRRDNLIVLSNGRNVSPEWIEAMITSDTRINRCIIEGHGETRTRASITPSSSGAAWFSGASAQQINDLIGALCQQAPAYARPGTCQVVKQPEHVPTG